MFFLLLPQPVRLASVGAGLYGPEPTKVKWENQRPENSDEATIILGDARSMWLKTKIYGGGKKESRPFEGGFNRLE
jgi:hypothetical protein